MDSINTDTPRTLETETVITPALLYELHAVPLRRYLTWLLDDPTLAEDVCQETFLRALRAWHRRRPDGSASGWLYQIARNLAYDERIRRERICSVALHEARKLSSGELLDERWSNRTADRQAAMDCLNPTTRTVLLLYGAGYQAAEIAAMYERTAKAVLMIISRGRRRLHAQLQQESQL